MTTAADQRGPIVVGVDGSDESKAALAWALHQAQLTGGRLRVITTWEFPTLYGQGLIGVEGLDFAADARTELEKTVAEVVGNDAGVEIEQLVIEGHPALELTAQVEDAELVVVGSRGRGEFIGMLIGSVSEFLATHSACPVVIIRGPN